MVTVAENNNKRKRGRPDNFKKHYGKDAVKMKTYHESTYSSRVESKRGKNNEFYKYEAIMLLMDNDKEALKRDYVTPNGNFKNVSVLIEIGRMYMQENFTSEECISLSEQAIKKIHEGISVHQVARMIRVHRLTAGLITDFENTPAQRL